MPRGYEQRVIRSWTAAVVAVKGELVILTDAHYERADPVVNFSSQPPTAPNGSRDDVVSTTAASKAVLAAYAELFSHDRRGWAEHRGDLAAGVCSVRFPYFNGLWIGGSEFDEAEPDRLLSRVLSMSPEACLQTVPAQRAVGSALAKQHGMQAADLVPMLAVAVPLRGSSSEVVVEGARNDAALDHLAVAEPAFGAERGAWLDLFSSTLVSPKVNVAFVWQDDEPVATLLSVRAGGAVGVFNVATRVDQRRKGLAAALLRQTVNESLADGCDFVWLQSTPDSHGLYESLGFEVVERWPSWVKS